MADEDPANSDNYVMSGLTQTQVDNLNLIVGDNYVGTMPIDVEVFSQEPDNGDLSATSTTGSFEITTTAVEGNDVLTGTSGDDYLFGQSGNDYIDGLGGDDYILGGSGDDTIVFDVNDSFVDGGTGYDTLTLNYSDNIDFDAIASGQLNNIEAIDLSVNGDHNISNLGINDLLDMTDTDNELTIMGDSGDTVALIDGDGGDWLAYGSDGAFDLYVLQGDESLLTLMIDQDINTSIL